MEGSVVKEEIFTENLMNETFLDNKITKPTDIAVDENEIQSEICLICNMDDSLALKNRVTDKIELYCNYCFSKDFQNYHMVWLEEHYMMQNRCDRCADILKNGYFIMKHDCYELMWCNNCSVIFDREKDSVLHSKICNSKRKSFFCIRCCKSFKVIGRFKRHTTICTLRRPYSCDVCSKYFTKPNKLKTHLRVHFGDRLHFCHICSKSFKVLCHLKYHLRTHSGEKPYTCYTCYKSFSHSTTLKNHSLVHSGEKPYSCDFCSKSFTNISNLKRHSRIHSGDKPYCCDFCSKSFTNSSNLKRHLQIHSGCKPYSCHICFKSFNWLKNLKTHLKTHSDQTIYT